MSCSQTTFLDSIGAERNWSIKRHTGAVALVPAAETCWRDAHSALIVSRPRCFRDDQIRLTWGDYLSVDVFADGSLSVCSAPDVPSITVDHFIADQVIPRLLAHEGSFIIHAGAVSFQGTTLIFMGNSGFGKSTLASSFEGAGHILLGDDAMIISTLNTVPHTRAVYPSLRLFPDSVDALMLGDRTAGAVAHFADKKRMDVAVDRLGADVPLPVKAVFSLGEAACEITIRRLTASESCITFLESSFALDPSDTTEAQARLNDASTLARHVPAFKIFYPRDYAKLPEVRQAILDQVAALEPA